MNSLPARRGEGVEGEAIASGGAARSLEDLTSRRLRLKTLEKNLGDLVTAAALRTLRSS